MYIYIPLSHSLIEIVYFMKSYLFQRIKTVFFLHVVKYIQKNQIDMILWNDITHCIQICHDLTLSFTL